MRRISPRNAERCYDCKHMRRFHHKINERLDMCYRCTGRHPTQDRAKGIHKFLPYPTEPEVVV